MWTCRCSDIRLKLRGSLWSYDIKELRPFQRLLEVPKPGEALPYYGEVGAAYHFTFRPYEHSCRLKVENICAGMAWFYPPDKFPPLELDVPEPIQIEADTSGTTWHGLNWGWWYHPKGEFVLDEITFVIDGEMYDKLMEWEWDRGRADTYEYQFIPSSVGCEIFVRDTITGEEGHLTKDVCW
jgi:hypothetical protein